jgi:hypothetical protein
LIRGLSAGFGPALVIGALPFLAVGAAGFVILLRRRWTLAVALTMPGILNASLLIAKRLTFSPRFFLLYLPLAILAAVQGIYSVAELAGRFRGKNAHIFSFRLAAVLVLGVCIISLAPLRYYYSIPKQAYRASIQYLEAERKPGEIVIVIDLAESGYRYYGEHFGLQEDKDYFFIRSMEALDSVLSFHTERRSFLVTTLHRLLRIRHPNIHARITKDWTVIRTFPGTMGDGEIAVWRLRESL